MNIEKVIEAFDEVIPGYAWAWHDAVVQKRARSGRKGRERGWRDSRRRNLSPISDRCLLVYGFRFLGDDDRSVVIFNRGYVALFQAAMLGRAPAVEAFRSMCDDSADIGRGFFTSDATPFETRCEICRNVLGYIRGNASSVASLWRDAPDLARES